MKMDFSDRNQIGDLWVKCDSLCAGYWNQPEKTKNTFVGDWFRTGDKYRQDEDGFFRSEPNRRPLGKVRFPLRWLLESTRKDKEHFRRRLVSHRRQISSG